MPAMSGHEMPIWAAIVNTRAWALGGQRQLHRDGDAGGKDGQRTAGMSNVPGCRCLVSAREGEVIPGIVRGDRRVVG
ncbi:hypothetical protein CMUS01_14179 [Colletotrichum musicola]|uniref:Uncharacterized protein n=1 Tax=Colletotrichum musicola TaxID=2175873 RepID=A0A8H6J713_9PEZI|nr:hypothetical protein CMUS01_14179 [Colletotrichum musicola]